MEILQLTVVVLTLVASTSVLGQSSSGGQFFVPARFFRQPPPSTLYGAPPPPPPPSFTSTTTTTTSTTTEVPTTTTKEPDVDVSRGAVSIANAQSGNPAVYYVLQPDGRLQRIAYAHGPTPARLSNSQQQQQQKGYLARFHYRDLEPLGAPVYSYSAPELVRLRK